MKHRKSHQQLIIVGAVLLLAVLGMIIVAWNWDQVQQVLGEADWRLVPVALLFSALSYVCLVYGFVVICRLFRVRMSRRLLFEVGFVSFALGHLVASGGVAGYSLRFLLLKKRGLPIKGVVVASLFHSTLNNLFLFALVPIGLVFLLLNYPLPRGEVIDIGLAAGLLFVLVVLVVLVVFSDAFRARVLNTVSRVWSGITRREIEKRLEDFNSTLAQGVGSIRARPLALALPIVLVVSDWAAMVAVLGFCFDALGHLIGPGVLVIGFAVGIAAGLLSMIPGGLGVQEGSMAAVYALLGVPFGQAVLAAILFRVAYYFIPFLVSLSFYWRLMRGEDDLVPEP